MIEVLNNWIVNIVSVIILIVFVEMVMPGEKFKKHIKLVTGLILMIVIINPIVAFINKGMSMDMITVQSFNKYDKAELEKKTKQFENIKNSQVIDIYKDKIKSQIREQVLTYKDVKDAQVDVKINEEANREDFGKILKIDLKIDKNSIDKGGIEPVKKVNIDLDKSKDDAKEEIEFDKIRKYLSQTYSVDEKDVAITLG